MMSTITEKTRLPLSLVLTLVGAVVAGVIRNEQANAALERRQDVLVAWQTQSEKEFQRAEKRVGDQDETLTELRRRTERIDVTVLWIQDEMRRMRDRTKTER